MAHNEVLKDEIAELKNRIEALKAKQADIWEAGFTLGESLGYQDIVKDPKKLNPYREHERKTHDE